MGAKGKYYTHVEPKLDRIANWCKQGLTEKQIYNKLGVGHTAFGRYKNDYEELRGVLKEFKEVADETVENSLYKRANGYDWMETTQEVKTDGEGNLIEKKKKVVTKHVIADTTAQIFWLKNRKLKTWGDHKGGDTTPETVDFEYEEIE